MQTEGQVIEIARPLVPPEDSETGVVVASDAMIQLMGHVRRVALGNDAVLITGETGSGKEVIARAIHRHSLRCNKPWVDVNCGALPENLVESELFGYEKGAFSGADSTKPGLFELAHTGTLFLDEIGDLDARLQVKLLRVLDGVPYYRLGGSSKVTTDVRVIAATNQPLNKYMESGRFRRDLYHRLTQFQLHVPPLRERPKDIEALARHFLHQRDPLRNLSDAAIDCLCDYSWPGNVRELFNVVVQAFSFSNERVIRAEHIQAFLPKDPAPVERRPADLGSVERQTIFEALERTGGRKLAAAEQLGISRRTLSRKLKQYRSENEVTEISNPQITTKIDSSKFEGFAVRYAITATVNLRSFRGEEENVVSLDVGTEGLSVTGLEHPERFAGPLEIILCPQNTTDIFRLHGRIVWISPDSQAGIELCEVNQGVRQRLARWLEHSASAGPT